MLDDVPDEEEPDDDEALQAHLLAAVTQHRNEKGYAPGANSKVTAAQAKVETKVRADSEKAWTE